MSPAKRATSRLLTKLGLLVEPAFLDRRECAAIEREMVLAEPTDGLITDADGRQVLDQTRRRSSYRSVGSETVELVESRLAEALPRIETHFDIPVERYEGPRFVAYEREQFFAPHRDDQGDRRINLTIPVSDRGIEQDQGGNLVIYGLVDGDDWAHRGFPVDFEPGTLIGYRSDLLHEVRPVTGSRRSAVIFHLLGRAGQQS